MLTWSWCDIHSRVPVAALVQASLPQPLSLISSLLPWQPVPTRLLWKNRLRTRLLTDPADSLPLSFLSLLLHHFCQLTILGSTPLFSPPSILPSVGWWFFLKNLKISLLSATLALACVITYQTHRNRRPGNFPGGGGVRREVAKGWGCFYRKKQNKTKNSQLVALIIINEINADSLLATLHRIINQAWKSESSSPQCIISVHLGFLFSSIKWR